MKLTYIHIHNTQIIHWTFSITHEYIILLSLHLYFVYYNEIINHYIHLQNPLDVDLVINLPHDGIRLIFDPVVQRLKIIEIYNMKLVKLKYCGLPFNSPEVLPSIEQIEHSFGATHPGVYDSEKQVRCMITNIQSHIQN